MATLRPQPITRPTASPTPAAAPAPDPSLGEVRRAHALAVAEAVVDLPQERAAIFIAACMTASLTRLIEAGVDPLVVSEQMALWKEDLRGALVGLRLRGGLRLH